MQESSYHIEKQIHPIKVRSAWVKSITRPTPHMARITLQGDDLHDFYSPGFDDHVKLLFSEQAGQELAVPQVGERGLVFDEGQAKPVMRDYTPLAYDNQACEMVIDFVLHGTGVASTWAEQAKEGDRLLMAGPRGSMLIPTVFDWQVLVGDETALPAITRRLRELKQGTKVSVVVAINHEEARMPLSSAADIDVHWVVEPNGDVARQKILATLQSLAAAKQGEGFAWGAVEYSQVGPVREASMQHFDLDASRVKVSSYWRRDE